MEGKSSFDVFHVFLPPNRRAWQLSAVPSVIGIKDSSGDATVIAGFAAASRAHAAKFSVLTGASFSLHIATVAMM